MKIVYFLAIVQAFWEEKITQVRHQLYTEQQCSMPINRLKGSGDSFDRLEQLYWFGYSPFSVIWNNHWDLMTGQIYWVNLSDKYPDAPLFPSGPIIWDNIMQSSLGDCYLVAAMAEISTIPKILDDIFVTKKTGKEYKLKLYVRGRPWIVNVDDQFLYHKELDNLRFAYYEDSLWIPILEKALAKIKGNYDQLEGGFPANMLRFLTGAPVFTYSALDEKTEEEVWYHLSSHHYLITASTKALSDQKLN